MGVAAIEKRRGDGCGLCYRRDRKKAAESGVENGNSWQVREGV